MLLRKDGITIDVIDADVERYLRAGYKKVEEEKPAPAKKAVVVKKGKVVKDES